MQSKPSRRWLWLLAALSPLAQADWSQLPSAVTVTQTPRAFDRVNKQLFSYATITNTSTEAVPGPFRLVIPTSNLNVTNPSGTTDGKPYLTFGGTALAPGQRLTVRVNFTNTASRLTYTTQPERYTDPTLAVTAPDTVTEVETVSPVGFAGGSSGGVTYHWSQISGPSITLLNETTNQPTFIAPTVTDRTLVVLKALITDPLAPSGYGVSSTKVDIDVVPAGNHVVQATTSGLLAYTGDAVSLHANCTGLGTSPSYSWTQVSPATPVITLIDPDTANPTFTAPDSTAIPANSAQTFTFQVTCTDIGGGVTAVDKTSVLISGPIVLKPNAPLTVSGSSGVPPQPLVLQGSTPSPTVVSGQAFQLAVPVFGGTAPYSWSWTPTDGGPALTVDPATGVASGVAPSVGVATTYHYTAQVTGSGGSGSKTATVAVNLIPAPVPSTPLSVSLPVNALYFGEGQQNIALPSQAFGGTGPYTYSWQYVPFHNGPAVTLTGANTSHASFNAPLVDGDTNLGFRVTVTDSASHSVVGSINVRINDLAPTLNVSTTSPITAKVDETVSLNFPMPQGGAGGYSYAISQTGGTTATLSSTTSRNPTFTVPTGASGDQTFVMTVTDSAGNQVEATQIVRVEAPPLNVALSGPDHGEEGSTVSLNAVAAGGIGPYTYASSVSGASLSIPAVANPSFTLPSVPSGSTLDLAVTLTVTDASGPTPNIVTSVFNVTVNKPVKAPVYYSSLCDGRLCLIAEEITACDADHPYAMTTVEDNANYERHARKWCGSAFEARRLWYDMTSDNNGGCISLLYPGDGSGPAPPTGYPVTCHFACKPRGADIGVPDYACNGGGVLVPPQDTLMQMDSANPDKW